MNRISYRLFCLVIMVVMIAGCGSKFTKKVSSRARSTNFEKIENPFKLQGKDHFEAIFDISENTQGKAKNSNKKWTMSLRLKSDTKTICDSVWLHNDRNQLFSIMLKNCMKAPYKEPLSVNFQYKNKKFEPVDPVEGTKIDTVKLKQLIRSNWNKKTRFIDLEKDSVYLKPYYDLEAEETKKSIESLEQCLETIIEYKVEDKVFTIDHQVFGPWVSLDADMKIKLDFYQMQDYLQTIASKVERPMSEILEEIETIKAVNDTSKSLEEITCQKVNIINEIDQISKLIPLGKKVTKEITFVTRGVPKGLLRGLTDFVEVSLVEQKLWLFKNGNLILETDVVTGRQNSTRETPKGSYSIKTKTRNRTLRGPGYEAFVSYWMPFYKGYGLHDANWRRRFGSNIYARNGSHGCINIPPRFAPVVYNNVEVGTTVIIN